MNLDFLDVLSQPIRETVGTARTVRTDRIHASLPVPNPVLAVGNRENQAPGSPVGEGNGSQWFPPGSRALGTEMANLFAVVPKVPRVPNENEQVYTERATVQVSRWMATRCRGASDDRNNAWPEHQGSRRHAFEEGDCDAA